MKKAVFIVSLILVVMTTTVVAAAGVNGDYKGNPIINVVINGVKLAFPDVPAIGYNGRTMLPLRASVESVNGIVEWDNKTQTATVIKPETSIFFFTIKDDGSMGETFSAIPILESGEKFYSMLDIGGILKGTYTVKCEILNQSGTVVSYTGDMGVEIKEDYSMVEVPVIWDSTELLPETYKFVVSMKNSQGVYKTIATKTMSYK